MAQYVKVIQKNKGAFKNFLKKIEQIQDFKATCGIHKDVGRLKKVISRTSLSADKKSKKYKTKGYESDKVGEFKKRSKAKRGSRPNIATLSKILETHLTWTQRSTIGVNTADGEGAVIHAGAKMRQPARYHIHLENVSNVWAEVKQGVQFETMRYMMELQRSRGKRSAQNLFKEIAEKVSERQRQRITNKETASNKPLTVDIKGFDWPLFQTGQLLRSITGRIVKNSTGKKVRCAYVATNMDEIIRKINSSIKG